MRASLPPQLHNVLPVRNLIPKLVLQRQESGTEPCQAVTATNGRQDWNFKEWGHAVCSQIIGQQNLLAVQSLTWFHFGEQASFLGGAPDSSKIPADGFEAMPELPGGQVTNQFMLGRPCREDGQQYQGVNEIGGALAGLLAICLMPYH